MSQKKPIKITLFHAEWCGHCTNFMPTWNNMSKDPNACKNIEFEAYEEQTIGALDEKVRTVDGTDVRSFGYPTLKITVNGNEFIYQGRRTPEEIYQTILDALKSPPGKFNKGVVVSKDSEGIKVSTSVRDVSESSREASDREVIDSMLNRLSEQFDEQSEALTDKDISDRLTKMRGGSSKKVVKRLTDSDFKFLNDSIRFSDINIFK